MAAIIPFTLQCLRNTSNHFFNASPVGYNTLIPCLVGEIILQYPDYFLKQFSNGLIISIKIMNLIRGL